MDINTKAAIHAIHLEAPKAIQRDSQKHNNDQAAAENLKFITETLISCFDRKKRPPASLLYALRGLGEVAELLDKAAEYTHPLNDVTEVQYKRAKKQAADALLECFGMGPSKGRPQFSRNELIQRMAQLLCPPVNEDWEPIGEPECNTVEKAANTVEEELGREVTARTAKNAWAEYVQLFKE